MSLVSKLLCFTDTCLRQLSYLPTIAIFSFFLHPLLYTQAENSAPPMHQQQKDQSIIKDIVVIGNKLIPAQAIINRLHFKKHGLFDPSKTSASIKNVYNLGRFSNVELRGEITDNREIILYVVVTEKIVIKEVIFKGNSALSEKEIRKKIDFNDIPAIDEQELKKFVRIIKKLYWDRGFYQASIDAALEIDPQERATIIFTITENRRSLVRQVLFAGNNHLRSKVLRAAIFTKEDWIGSVLDKSGTYQPERLEADAHMIEQYYSNAGFLHAKVVDIKQEQNENGDFIITFIIDEGDQYRISTVDIVEIGPFVKESLLAYIPLRPGNLYARDAIVESIKRLESSWGDMGYLFAHIDPSIIPDEETKTVAITFHCEPGNQIMLNNIYIRGNTKTKDKIIRRQIILEEGQPATHSGMEISKNRIASLGYFDQRDGVIWQIKRIDKDNANLHLMVKEAKTGNASIQLNFGGSEHTVQSPLSGIAFETNVSDRNLFGTGIRVNLTGKLSKDEQLILFNITQPWLCDRPIHFGLDTYHKRISYDDLNHTRPVNETHTGGSVTLGALTGWHHELFHDIFIRTTVGGDHVRYEHKPTASILSLDIAQRASAEQQYNMLLASLFEPGNFVWVALHAGQEKRNHPVHPSRGMGWLARSQVAIPTLGSSIGFFKNDLDVHWYTPLIGEHDLVLHLHGYAGFIHLFNKRVIPYRELFHIGGPASVRGFLYGQIGPQFSAGGSNDSIGGKKAIFLNAELVFPITSDFNMKGLLFYDGGTGWDAPFSDQISPAFLKNNSFHYRHAVGFGIRLLSPVPLSVDWGFKIDPKKWETASEVHFNMSYGW